MQAELKATPKRSEEMEKATQQANRFLLICSFGNHFLCWQPFLVVPKGDHCLFLVWATEVMSCVVRVVHEDMRHSHWASKAFDPKFIFELQEFNPDELKDDVMHLLDTHCSDPTLTAEKMESWKGPPIVRILNRWLHAVQCFGRVGAKLKPKLEEWPGLHWSLHLFFLFDSSFLFFDFCVCFNPFPPPPPPRFFPPVSW